MSCTFESLEQRSLMSASLLSNGTLLVSNTSDADHIAIMVSETNPQLVQYARTGPAGATEFQEFQRSRVLSLSVHTWGGNDMVYIGPGLPGGLFSLGSGSDKFTSDGATSAETIYCGPDGAHDIGADGADEIFAGGGNDIVYGGDAADALYGQGGNDRLFGEGGKDRLYGGTGSDRLNGGAGDDVIDGGAGSDRMYGEAGNDVIRARDGIGGETVDGGAGFDRASFDFVLSPDQLFSVEAIV